MEKNNIIEGWSQYKLKDCLTLVNGRAYKQVELLSEGTTPVIRIQNLNDGDNWYYSDLKLSEDKYCYKGDLLFAWSTTFGPYLWDGERAIYHYHIWKVIPKNNCNKFFAFYYLDYLTQEIKSHSHGGTMLHITKGKMEEWSFPLPSLSEQQRIVQKINLLYNRIDKAIILVKDNITNTKQLMTSVLNEIFTVGIKEFKEVPLMKHVTIVGGSQPPKQYFSYEPKDGYIRLIQIRDYKSDNHLVYIKSSSTKKFCNESDVMIGRYGPPVFQILRGLNGAYNVALMKAIPDEDYLTKDYLYWFLQNPNIQNYIIGISQRSAGQSGVNKVALEKYTIPVPPLDIQNKISAYLESISLKQSLLEKKQKRRLKDLKALKASILEAAFKGELSNTLWDTLSEQSALVD